MKVKLIRNYVMGKPQISCLFFEVKFRFRLNY